MSAFAPVLPHDIAAEQTVLGCVLILPALFAEVSGDVSWDDFYHPTHAAIFRSMSDLDAAHKPIDPITVAAQLRANGQGEALKAFGDSYFGELTSAVVTTDNVGFHAKRIRAKAQRRARVHAFRELAAVGYGDCDDDEFFERCDAALSGLYAPASAKATKVRSLLKGVREAVEARVEAKNFVTGVPTGWVEVNDLTAGWQPKHLVVLAARPGMGKTSLVIGTVIAAAEQKIPSLVFSLEMGKDELVERMVAVDGRIDSTHLRDGRLDPIEWKRMVSSFSRLDEHPVWICDDGGMTFPQIRSVARKWRADSRMGGSHRHAVVAIDYLGLLSASADERRMNSEQRVSGWSRAAKMLAKELDCPVLLLSQLNRECEKRDNKRPQLSDLRDSGQIEADADLVAFLYNDEKYNPETEERGITEVIVSKQRAGRTGTVKLKWQAQWTRFESMREAH